jgi:hypothetical protein
MLLIVTLDLSPEMEAELRQSINHNDIENVRQLLAEALVPTVENLFQEVTESAEDEEWEIVADQLINELAASLSADMPPLSNHAVSRASIYEDHL